MKKQIVALAFLTLLLLISCAQMKNNTSVRTPSPTIADTHRWFDAISSTPVMLPSPPYSIHTLLENSTNQTTDGRLEVYVREVKPKCHEFKDYATWSMDVEFVFLNITSDVLKVPSRFMVTKSGWLRSDVNPYWFNQDGSYIRLSTWYRDDTPDEPVKSFVEIPGGGYYKTVINIILPDHLSGTFIVKFVFNSNINNQSSTGSPDVWAGTISSNPIEVCLIH